MNAGRLRDIITVEQRSQSQDSFGQPLEVWTTVLSDYAEVKQLSGREFFSDAATKAAIDTRIIMRYRSGIEPKQRIRFESKILDIEMVIVDQKKTQLEIMCKA